MEMKMRIILIILVLASSLMHACGNREKIGEAMGQSIYRNQLKDEKNLYSQLHRLFRSPFEKNFIESHKKELMPEKWEIDYMASYFSRKHEEDMKNKNGKLKMKLKFIEDQLKNENLTEKERKNLEFDKELVLLDLNPPDTLFCKELLSHWKFHRFLYDNYGGGRVIWEQEGFVAFDAMLKWIKHHEEKGDFKIADPALRKEFYSYWTRMDKNRTFFLNRNDLKKFIHPEWEPTR